MSLILPKERTLFLSKQVDQQSIYDITKSIIDINENDELVTNVYAAYGLQYSPKPIRFFIDSYGGWVYQCFGLLSVMENSKTPLHTIVTGAAMSCGFLISIAGHERFCYSKSTFMYHQITTGNHMKIGDMEVDMVESKRLQSLLEVYILQNTKITKKQLAENYKTKSDWFFDADQALKYGIVDKIL